MHPKYKYFLSLLIGCIAPILLYAQEISIRGVIPGGDSSILYLSTYSDYISYKREVLAEVELNERGEFVLETELYGLKLVYLDMHHYRMGLFVESGNSYVLSCDSIDVKDEYRPMYNKEPLPCRIETEPEPGLNGLISQFTSEFNEFVIREFSSVYQRRNTNILNAFKQKCSDDFGGYNIPFLDQYIRYKIAGIEIAMAPAKKPALYTELLKDKPVLLDNPEYMTFFKTFYDQHLYPDNRYIPRIDLYTTINYLSEYGPLMDSLGKDSTLVNEKFRELVCINALNKLYTSPDFSKDGIIKILNYIAQNSKFREHKLIAQNVVDERTKLEVGYPPPEILINDLEGNAFDFSQLNGKPVYLSFITTWSYGCLTELELLKTLQEEYTDTVHFISISLDENPHIVKQLVEEKGYNWTFLYNGTDPRLMQDLQIKTFPVFMLLDQEGKLVEYPAYKPSEVIRDSFERLLRQ